MIVVEKTEEFQKWHLGLKDKTSKTRITARLDRVEQGNLGDFKNLKDGLYELRFTFGGGIRVYYTWRGDEIVLLLAGGNKSDQEADIARAKEMISEL